MRSFFFKLFLLITLFVLSSGVLFAQVNWTKYTGNPVIPSGPNGSWYRGVFAPCVLYNADSLRYEMWFSASYSTGGSRPIQIGFATSIDGLSWSIYPNPVFSATPGSWDSYTVEIAHVICENGQYKMWYGGAPDFANFKIGYATSPDGINWTKYPNPVFEAGTEPWEAGGVEACFVMPVVGGYKMWYTGYTTSGASGKICVGYATSPDGITWYRQVPSLPVLEPSDPGIWDDTWDFAPRVLFIQGLYYIWFTGTGATWAQFRIGLATSSDGISWTKYPAPVLQPSPSGWDGSEVESGYVIMMQDSLYMWYDGSSPSPFVWQIGLAISTPFIPIPVELTTFTATSNGTEVILNWSTATETNNSGFSIERKSGNSKFTDIGFVPGFGTTTEPKSYSYTDSKLSAGKYTYRLKQIDFDGSYEYSKEVEVEVAAPFEFSLEQNFPNPFNPSTKIKYSIPQSSQVHIKVYDVLGNEIETLVKEEKPAGSYELTWNAANLPSGVYFYQLRAGSFVETKKMVLMK